MASAGLPSWLVLRGLLRVLVLVHFRNQSFCASDFAHPGVAFIRVGLGISHVTKLLYSGWMRLCLRWYAKKGILVRTSKESGGIIWLCHFLPSCPLPTPKSLPAFLMLDYLIDVGGNPVYVKAWKVVSFHALTSHFLFALFEVSSPPPRLLSCSSLFPWGSVRQSVSPSVRQSIRQSVSQQNVKYLILLKTGFRTWARRGSASIMGFCRG